MDEAHGPDDSAAAVPCDHCQVKTDVDITNTELTAVHYHLLGITAGRGVDRPHTRPTRVIWTRLSVS